MNFNIIIIILMLLFKKAILGMIIFCNYFAHQNIINKYKKYNRLLKTITKETSIVRFIKEAINIIRMLFISPFSFSK